ncbi:MAG: CopG family ribbon-helix-helix protein [archaeon]|nr:CopG family ribbon-helix-helix protein [archaeon]
MTIMSVSITDELLSKIESIEKEFGFSGRSEVVRAGLMLLTDEMNQRSGLKGNIDALVVVSHSEENEVVSKIRHKHNEVIKTQMHNHLSNGKCLEIFIAKGNAKKIKELANEFSIHKKIDFAKLIIS